MMTVDGKAKRGRAMNTRQQTIKKDLEKRSLTDDLVFVQEGEACYNDEKVQFTPKHPEIYRKIKRFFKNKPKFVNFLGFPFINIVLSKVFSLV